MPRSLGLVLDLSFTGFAAVVDAGENTLAKDWRPPGARYDDVADWVEGRLKTAGGTFTDLDWIAVGVGPGSFTGIRIAMAFAQGVALPRELPLHGFNSLAPLLLARELNTRERQIAVIPANAGRFYAASDLHETGVLVEAEELLRLANSETSLVVPAIVPQMESLLAGFGNVFIVEDHLDIPRVVKHARESGLGALCPHYLQASAAEVKAGVRA